MTPEVHARLHQIPEWPGPDAKHSSNTLPDHVYNYKDSAFPATFMQDGSCCSAASGIGYTYTYECNILKGVSAKKAANLCAYGFLYDFLNDGAVDQGCWYYDAWDIAKKTGCLSKTDFGGEVEDKTTEMGESRWGNGYIAYHNAYSQCRDSSYYTISVKDSAGIWKLKQWMYDHGRGDAIGGTATFSWYSEHNFTTIPTGMPDEGKKSLLKSITKSNGSSQSEHAMTFAGYDDRIGASSSGELGAVLLQNSWGTSYGDSGRSWVPYRFLKSPASKNADSTIYENTVYVIEVRKHTVKLDYKVTISHSSRSKIQIKTGYANSATATSATTSSLVGTTTTGSAFNYSGGAYPMEGKGGDSTIEIGLDVTDFYTAMTGTQATFFLMITSKGGSGSVKSFSLMDYTGDTVTETACSKTNVTITSGATTTLSIVYTKPTTAVASSVARKITTENIKVNKDNSLFVPFSGKSSVAIANMQGRQFKSFETIGQGWHTMPVQITAGKYVVTIVNAGKSYSRKIDIVK
ncbi:MAG TPA: hypothetical protein DCO75_10760 [Fibrobacteres bacterium]|nr:hypothetical protein [Fibrobacterota bacterium]